MSELEDDHALFDPVFGGEADALLDNDQRNAQRAARQQEEQLRDYLRKARGAYARVFSGGNSTQEDRDFVLQDLAWFVRLHSTPWDDDPGKLARNVGRQETLTRVLEYAGLSVDELTIRTMKANAQNFAT